MNFRNKYYIVLLVLLLCNKSSFAQDPNFSQFTASPLSINPALTSNGASSWRAMSNVRTQWVGIGSSYTTQSLSIDGKVKKLDDDNYLGIGGMMIAEKAMDGIYKSTTRIDFSQLSFDQQLSSIGFDRALPTGEPSLSNANSFSSACAGIMYTYEVENTFLNVGAAGYRFVKSNRSILDDKTQYISPRYDIHADFGTAINERVNLNVSAVHMIQNGTKNTALGTSVGLLHNSNDFNSEQLRMINLGMFYKLGTAVTPYVGYVYNNFQVGLSYDVNVSAIRRGRYHSPF